MVNSQFQIRARHEALLIGPGLDQGFLDKIIGTVRRRAERTRERPQAWNGGQQFPSEKAVFLRIGSRHLGFDSFFGQRTQEIDELIRNWLGLELFVSRRSLRPICFCASSLRVGAFSCSSGWGL